MEGVVTERNNCVNGTEISCTAIFTSLGPVHSVRKPHPLSDNVYVYYVNSINIVHIHCL